jgi:selenocysteine lyase/cysteine desulfurase
VLVDGAHSLGQLDLNIADLGVDFFVANCHKWLCAPRGTAIMWVARQHQRGFQPLVKSHGHGWGFTSDFIWDGARALLRRSLISSVHARYIFFN